MKDFSNNPGNPPGNAAEAGPSPVEKCRGTEGIMKITENFKSKLMAANKAGYDTVQVSRGGNWGNTAVSNYKINYLLGLELGDDSTSGGWGIWLTAADRDVTGVIGYQEVFKRF